jgi:hypothetical protein
LTAPARAVGDSEFVEGVAALVNIRNVLFLNDLVGGGV